MTGLVYKIMEFENVRYKLMFSKRSYFFLPFIFSVVGLDLTAPYLYAGAVILLPCFPLVGGSGFELEELFSLPVYCILYLT